MKKQSKSDKEELQERLHKIERFDRIQFCVSCAAGSIILAAVLYIIIFL